MKNKLPLEQRTKDEADKISHTWKNAPYNFLLQRTTEKYNLKSNRKRRKLIEKKLNKSLPCLTDLMLKDLYMYSCTQYQQQCSNQYHDQSGFYTTPYERKFLETIEYIISKNPELKYLEVYPSSTFNKDLPKNFKMVIGNFVPDFIIFGLKSKGSSAVCFEVNGDSHIYKYKKDETRNRYLEELKVITIEIPNEQVGDVLYIEKILKQLYRRRNGSFNSQILRIKRSIWIKTIACQLSLNEIENYLKKYYDISLCLHEEALQLVVLDKCPKVIKRELKCIL